MKVGVVPTKTDDGYLLHHESDKAIQRKESGRRRKRREKISDFFSGVGDLSLEIRTGNCSKLITL